MSANRTQVTWSEGHLRIVPSESQIELTVAMTEIDAKLIRSTLNLVFLEGKQEGAAEAFASAKKSMFPVSA